jgi:hypothetical protein
MTDAAVPTVADATRAVLLAARLRPVPGPGGLPSVLASLSLAVDDLDVLVGRLELAGLIEERPKSAPGWRVTPEGREEGERLLAAELDGLGVRAAVTGAYERFVSHNGALLRACTDWQLRDANPPDVVVNDHSDPVYDRAVITRLGAVHDAVLPVCDDLAKLLGRFSGYRPRFTTAIDRVRAGDLDALDKPDNDSYHAIWFELHDHLLATTGRDRSAEPLPDSATTQLPPS